MDKPTVSIILYDAGYRENFHLFECLKEQTYQDFEILWVDYWGNVKRKLREYERAIENLTILCTLNRKDIDYEGGEYHHPQSINYGIAKARGEFIIVMDADLLIEPDYLQKVMNMHHRTPHLLTTGRDRPEMKKHNREKVTWKKVYPHTVFINPTNYGTCFTTRKEHILECNGWDESEVWRGKGGMFMADMGWRLVTYGLEHLWYMDPIALHPWHPGSHSAFFSTLNFKAFLYKLFPRLFPPNREQRRRKIILERLENGIYRVENGISNCL